MDELRRRYPKLFSGGGKSKLTYTSFIPMVAEMGVFNRCNGKNSLENAGESNLWEVFEFLNYKAVSNEL